MKSRDTTPRRLRGTTRALVESARLLRRDLTPAETNLWHALRGRQVAGLRFRCQHPIGPFVADFLCPAANLIVEVDGPIHDYQIEQDAARTDYLTALGYRVLRVRNDDVLHRLPAVLARIATAASTVPPDQRQRRTLDQAHPASQALPDPQP
jgi:very-short-patch-repair endonuclease